LSLYRHPKSAYWWVRFTIGGREVRQSSGTKDRKDAEEYEHKLRARYWRQTQLGEQHHTWKEARDRWLKERQGKRSLERDVRIFNEYRELEPMSLRETTADTFRDVRDARSALVSPATLNREFSLLRAVMNRAAKQWRWIDVVPPIPMAVIEAKDPRWLTRPQFQELLKHLPNHTAELARFAVATGIRRSNVTGLTWDRIDFDSRFAFIPGSQAKGKRGIPVPLNDDAIAVLRRQAGKHDTFCFTFRGNPVYQVATKAWREACAKAGVRGLRFHDLRHTWASWQAQSGTPAYVLREMGGWTTDAMVKRYSHLGAGDLAAYANRSLLKVGTPPKKRVARRAK
jgi:integrase